MIRTVVLSSHAFRACCADEDLVVLGDDVCVNAGAFLLGHELTRNGMFKRGPVDVGAGCIIGPGALLGPNVTAEAGSIVPALASALPGQTFRRGTSR